MRIQIESTAQKIILDGFECRIWRGTTEGGQECAVCVHRVQVDSSLDASEFETDLAGRTGPETVHVVPSAPLRLFL